MCAGEMERGGGEGGGGRWLKEQERRWGVCMTNHGGSGGWGQAARWHLGAGGESVRAEEKRERGR